MAQNVGSRSTAVIGVVSSILPAAILPGQRAIKGTPMPPCNRDRFLPRCPPVVPTEAKVPIPARSIHHSRFAGSVTRILRPVVRAENHQGVIVQT